MGVDVSSMTYVGVYTDDAEAYLIEKGILKEDQLEEDFYGDFNYAMKVLKCPLQVQAISYYSDEGYYVGFETWPSSYKDFDTLIERFKEITRDEASVESFEQWH